MSIARTSNGDRLEFGDSWNLLRKYACVLQWTSRVQAGWLPRIRWWEAKQRTALSLWEDAEMAQDFLDRCRDLRKPRKDSLEELEGTLSESVNAPTYQAFLAGIHEAIKVGLLDSIDEHQRKIYWAVDEPTGLLLEKAATTLKGQIRWHQELVAEDLDPCTEVEKQDSGEWVRYLKISYARTSGFLGLKPESDQVAQAPPCRTTFEKVREAERGPPFQS